MVKEKLLRQSTERGKENERSLYVQSTASDLVLHQEPLAHKELEMAACPAKDLQGFIMYLQNFLLLPGHHHHEQKHNQEFVMLCTHSDLQVLLVVELARAR